MDLVVYRGEVLAIVGTDEVCLSRRLEARERHDPLVRFVYGMAAYVLAIRAGSAPGPYTSRRAERFARLMLIDDEEFRFLEERRIRDYLIAGHFGVPIEQVREKRLDLLADQANRS